MEKSIEATIVLFKSYVGEKANAVDEDCLKKGVAIPENAPAEVKDFACRYYGVDHLKINQSFHKDYSTVAKADLETLIIQQAINYATTYGFEAMGMPADAYVPNEKLDMVEVLKTFTIINPISKAELKERVVELASSGVALSSFTLKNLKYLLTYIDNYEVIKNRELRSIWYEANNSVPSEADEFIRYLIYIGTGSTLKINSPEFKWFWETAKKFQPEKLEQINKALSTYNAENGLVPLARIWYRNEWFFLAVKNKGNRTIINKIRKLAYKHYKPAKVDILSLMSSKEFSDEKLKECTEGLKKVTIYKLFALYNTLSYSKLNSNLIAYRVRNGKTFIKDTERNIPADIDNKIKLVLSEIQSRIDLAGKSFYIPHNISYGAPISEKAFIGNVPENTVIELDKPEDDLIVGIHWNNVKTEQGEERIDLDLHAYDELGRSFGWNSAYKDVKNEILFTGDMTDAPTPNGASEFFFVSKNVKANMIMSVTNFTRRGVKVPFDIIIAKADHSQELDKNYIVNPNEIIFKMSSELTDEATLGSVVFGENIKFVMSAQSINTGIVGMPKEYSEKLAEITESKLESALTLNELLTLCGAEIVKTKNKATDLSLESISKDTFIIIFNGVSNEWGK